MSFLKKIRLIPAVWRAMREAKKRGVSQQEVYNQALIAAVAQAARNDGRSEEEASEYASFINSILSRQAGLEVPEGCLDVWTRFDPFDDGADVNFELTDVHLKMIRSLRFGFNEIEAGVPVIDAKTPYGDSDLFADLGEISSLSDRVVLAKLHTELFAALQIFLQQARLVPGQYAIGGVRPVSDNDAEDRVSISEDHLLALKALIWEWPEEEEIEEALDDGNWPVPSTNPECPYGVLPYYQMELAAALGWELSANEEGCICPTPEQDEKLASIHGDLLSVVRAFVQHAELSPGLYPRHFAIRRSGDRSHANTSERTASAWDF